MSFFVNLDAPESCFQFGKCLSSILKNNCFSICIFSLLKLFLIQILALLSPFSIFYFILFFVFLFCFKEVFPLAFQLINLVVSVIPSVFHNIEFLFNEYGGSLHFFRGLLNFFLAMFVVFIGHVVLNLSLSISFFGCYYKEYF